MIHSCPKHLQSVSQGLSTIQNFVEPKQSFSILSLFVNTFLLCSVHMRIRGRVQNNFGILTVFFNPFSLCKVIKGDRVFFSTTSLLGYYICSSRLVCKSVWSFLEDSPLDQS